MKSAMNAQKVNTENKVIRLDDYRMAVQYTAKASGCDETLVWQPAFSARNRSRVAAAAVAPVPTVQAHPHSASRARHNTHKHHCSSALMELFACGISLLIVTTVWLQFLF